MSEKCVLTSCCCGCTLRTGAITTAVFCLVAGIINAAYSIYILTKIQANAAWFNVVVYIIMLLVAILLMQGVRKENARLIRIWVYIELVILVLLIIGEIVTFVATVNIPNLIVGLVTIAIVFYFIMVVRSYALQLEAGGGAANTV